MEILTLALVALLPQAPEISKSAQKKCLRVKFRTFLCRFTLNFAVFQNVPTVLIKFALPVESYQLFVSYCSRIYVSCIPVSTFYVD